MFSVLFNLNNIPCICLGKTVHYFLFVQVPKEDKLSTAE